MLSPAALSIITSCFHGHAKAKALAAWGAAGGAGAVADATAAAEPTRGDPVEAVERVLRATWRRLALFHALLAINTARLSAEELHRRHQPVMTHFAPLIERGQQAGVSARRPRDVASRRDARDRHAASAELWNGRLTEAAAEDTMLSTVLAAIASFEPKLRAPDRHLFPNCSQ